MSGRSPNLLAIDDPLIAIKHCLQTNIRKIASSVGLAITLTPRVFARNDARKEMLLLFFGSEQQQRVSKHLNAEHIVGSTCWNTRTLKFFGNDYLL